jgi:hypothetical protein
LLKNKNKKQLKKHLQKNTYETSILENLIVKTATLLTLGFGQAGGQIIA